MTIQIDFTTRFVKGNLRQEMIFLNPSFDVHFKPQPPTRSPLEFHKQLPHYKPTPLHSLPALAEQLGIGKLLVKDESDRLGLPAFKILGASWAAYRVLSDRSLLPQEWSGIGDLARSLRSCRSLVFFSATDGNHGRAVARVANLLGLHARIYVPQGTAAARISGIESEGASVTVVDGTYGDAVASAAHDADASRGILLQDGGWEGYEVIPKNVVEGYSTIMWEIDDALDELKEQQPTHVVVQVGVGSLAEAVIRHYRHKPESVSVVGVEPESAACAVASVRAGKIVSVPGPHTSIMAGMNCDAPSLVSWQALLKGVNSYITLDDKRAREAMKLFATHGIVSGETGAAGLAALLEIMSDNSHKSQVGIDAQSRILLLSTEGATDPSGYQKNISQ